MSLKKYPGIPKQILFQKTLTNFSSLDKILYLFSWRIFYGFCHGKSPFFTTMWENIFDFSQASNKQIQDLNHCSTGGVFTFSINSRVEQSNYSLGFQISDFFTTIFLGPKIFVGSRISHSHRGRRKIQGRKNHGKNENHETWWGLSWLHRSLISPYPLGVARRVWDFFGGKEKGCLKVSCWVLYPGGVLCSYLEFYP